VRLLLLSALPLAALSTAVQAQERAGLPAPSTTSPTGFEVLTGAEYQERELEGGEKIDKLTVPLAARLTAGRVQVTAQLPYLRVTGPENVVLPGGPLGLPILVDPTRSTQIRTREGLGDARVQVAYDLGIPGVEASVNTGAKIPTAAVEKGLGTGEADYWAGADVSLNAGALTPFAGVSYTKVGDPESYDLQDSIAGQAGVALRLGGNASAHVGYSYAQSASELAQDEQRIFSGVSSAVSKRLSLGVYGSMGLAGPADVGAGVSLGIGFK
jgi:hypothetical protein